MKNEIIGICPCCLKAEKSAGVDIYVGRNDSGDITNMYIFGDDHFDVPTKNQSILDFAVSDDGKTITEIVCPRCKEKVAVSVPVIEDKNTKSYVIGPSKTKEEQAAQKE